jgi:purine-cytosine permease-like protein
MIVAVFGLFPAVAMKLLDFVALYGLVLMPMGAVLFVDFWLFPRLKLQPWWAERSGTSINLAAAVAWIGTLAVALWLVLTGRTQIFFVSLPGWFIAAAVYIVLSRMIQGRASPAPSVTSTPSSRAA